ncbi:rhamnogalacturonan lyase [Clostridium sp. SHJSY1]|uniref:rhamnogalacturonan lyase n=1 Tax=Clostridium sp. SHJSY1 TaxID=2942483 RepID=UPI002875C38F|nr:rhamnogalacturonan lyase [Clostridium sp. SHJSY1]MDS0524251.1 rhamnogalacturonan lyase [Clostridium sp. SHJSY1]
MVTKKSKKLLSITLSLVMMIIFFNQKIVLASDELFASKNNFNSVARESEKLYKNHTPILRQMENLDRAPIAMTAQDKGVYISWRLLGTDPEKTTFNIYRNGKKINKNPIKGATNYLDEKGSKEDVYKIETIIDEKIAEKTKEFSVLENKYLRIPVGKIDGYALNETSVGDLDGDGEYEFILLRLPIKYGPEDYPTTKLFPIFEAHKMDGTLLWRINMGPNFPNNTDINFSVYDLDNDGKAEFVVKTSEGTVDGTGVAIGDTDNDGKTDYRDSFVYNTKRQYITQGPEFLSVFEGTTGKELARTDYIARGELKQWGGNTDLESVHRASQALITPAYLDGKHASIVMTRGCWTLNKLEALDYKDGKFTKRWSFDSLDNPDYYDQGNHNLSVADIDYDGKDEIVWGSAAYDDNGKGMYTGYFHGDAMQLGKFIPDYPNVFEVASVHENVVAEGLQLRDARTGVSSFGAPNTKDAGRGLVADIDPRYDGPTLWGAGGTGYFVYDKGKWQPWSGPELSMNFSIWWDGDLLRELSDNTSVTKFNWRANSVDTLLTATGCHSLNGTKATPSLQADILGDWREEYILPTDEEDALNVYTTNIPTNYRIYTLMHDPVYRLGVAWQNNHYAQPPQAGFFLAHQTKNIPIPEIFILKDKKKYTNPDLKNKSVNKAKYPILTVPRVTGKE